jgi:serine/threonine protein kinase
MAEPFHNVSGMRTLRDGRYVVIGSLGEGSQGATLDAIDKLKGRPVAIKEFRVRGAKSWKDVELAEREARVLSTLSHPNLPVYVDHFEEAGVLYLVMERIGGDPLSRLRKSLPRMARADVLRFLSDAASALDYLHGRVPPIIHRDIKPGNVIRRADGSFVFVDFGSVRDSLKPEGGSTVVGTFGYMAPEQFQGRAFAGSDVYSVAATALTLLTGREPEALPHKGLAIDVHSALGKSVDPKLVRVLASMLEPDPDRRPQRITPLLRELDVQPRPARESRYQSEPFETEPGNEREARKRARKERKRARAEYKERRRELKDQTRRHEKEWRAWGEQLRSAQRELRNEARKRQHRYSSGATHGRNSPLIAALLILGITLARVANWGLFRLFLPTMLMLLSILFGPKLRRSARHCEELGLTADRSLVHAATLIRERLSAARSPDQSAYEEPRATDSRPRVRVEETQREVFDDFEAEQSQERERRRR